uniref:Uncharacterized protein n=1 Tax=Anguilla anguilla TaxID=7936 RepID=A0A0E9UQC9_ANGAN
MHFSLSELAAERTGLARIAGQFEPACL